QRRRRADRQFLDWNPGACRSIAKARERLRLLLCDRTERVLGRGAVGMPGMTEQAAQAKTAERRDRLDERHPFGVRVDAAAVESDVNLDKHVEGAPGALHRIRPAAGDG